MTDQFLFLLMLSFVAATLVQLLYWGVFYVLLRHEPRQPNRPVDTGDSGEKMPESETPGISVVICARNEEKKVAQNLPLILNQNYRSFEILIIDDHSEDGTAVVVAQFQKFYPYLRIVKNTNIKKSAGKKDALTLGVNSAKFDIIAVTDADCIPESPNWLQSMSEKLTADKDIVLGYGPYIPQRGMLNSFIRFETAMTALQYFSYANAGVPYMGVGRNMLYRKSSFEKNQGFSTHSEIASGDDDLFVREVATAKNTAISLDPETFLYSESKPDLRSYVRQKIRHLSTGKHYKWYHKLLLGCFGASHSWHYVALILLMLFKYYFILTICLYFLRIFVVTLTCAQVFKKLREQSILKSIVWLDAAMGIYFILSAFLPYITKNRTWK